MVRPELKLKSDYREPIKCSIIDAGFFSEYLKKKGLSDATIGIYVDVAESFIMETSDFESLDSYNNFLKKHIYDKKSNYYYFAIRSFIKYKILDNSLRLMLTRNLLKPKNTEPTKTTVYMTPTRREKVISMISSVKHQIIAKIQMQTGARVGDVLKLKHGSITYEGFNGALAMKIDFIGKRDKKVTKWIFDKNLQKEITDFIRDHALGDTYYFLDFERSYIRTTLNGVIRSNYKWYWEDLKNALIKCGFDPKTWSTHDFRRSISRDVWDDKDIGRDIEILKNFLGHANVSTTLRYLKHSGVSNRDVARHIAIKNGKLPKQ